MSVTIVENTVSVSGNEDSVIVRQAVVSNVVESNVAIPLVWGNINGTLSNQTDLQNALDLLVPYVGATADVDLDTFSLNAKSLSVNGTNGNGHIHLKHQASDANATGSSTVLFANSSGDLKYKNDGGFYTTFTTSANTANRNYTFPNTSGTVALTSNLSSYVPYTGATTDVNLNTRTMRGLGNLGLYAGDGTDGSTYIYWDGSYNFLDQFENPAFVKSGGFSVYDSGLSGYANITSSNGDISFLNASGLQAPLQTGGVKFWDVMNSGFTVLNVSTSGAQDLEYKNEYGAYLPIYMGATWLYDNMASGTIGVMDYNDGNFRFNDNLGNPVPIFHGTGYFYDSVQGVHGSIALIDEAYEFRTGLGSLAAITGSIVFADQLWGNFADGTAFITDKINSRVGVGISSPSARLHVYTPTATATYLKLGNSATSSLGTDGFDLGVSSTGVAEIRNYEATAMQFYCSNVNYMTLASNAPTLTLDSQGSNSANAGTLIMRTAGGSESCTLTFDASANIFKMLYGANNAITYTPTAITLNTPSSATGGVTTALLTANSWTNSTLVNKLLNGSVTVNQSGTAGFTFVDISYTVTAAGSGEANLLRFSNAGSDWFKIAASGQVTTRLGSNTVPSYSFVGDTDTGIYSSGANALDIVTGGVASLRSDSAAKVLVKQGGTTNLSGVMTTAWSSNTTIGNVGIGEDDLRSFTTAASTLNSNADAIHFDAVGLFAANANNKRVRVYFGGTLIFDTTALAFNGGNWRITGKIARVSTTTADIIVTWTSSNTTLQFSQTFTAFSGNLLASNILKLTAEATADNDVTQRNFQVWWQPS